jgi:hypothetical protein
MRLRFDELESKFTRSLDGDGKPRIEDFLERVPAEFRAPLLERLLLVECLRRESQGNSPPAVSYLERFSTSREVVERALAAAPTICCV